MQDNLLNLLNQPEKNAKFPTKIKRRKIAPYAK